MKNNERRIARESTGGSNDGMGIVREGYLLNSNAFLLSSVLIGVMLHNDTMTSTFCGEYVQIGGRVRGVIERLEAQRLQEDLGGRPTLHATRTRDRLRLQR